MPFDFTTLADDGEKLISHLADELGCPDDHPRATRMLQAILHVIRDQMPLDLCARTVSHLDPPLAAIFISDWEVLNDWPQIAKIDDLLTEIKFYSPRTTNIDFPTVGVIEDSVIIVLKHLQSYLPKSYMTGILKVLPTEIGQRMVWKQRA